MKCPVCGNETLEDVCPACGAIMEFNNDSLCEEINQELDDEELPEDISYLTIYGYMEEDDYEFSLQYFMDGELVANLGRNEYVKIPIDKDCTIEAKIGIRSCKIEIIRDVDTVLFTSRNPISGKIELTKSNSVSMDNVYEELDEQASMRNKKNNNFKILMYIAFAIIYCLWKCS